MKVCVYAIAKDEAKHAARWMAAVGEADAVYVLDTGSSDDTPELLRRLGASVTQTRIEPWRFDTARNRAMALLPEDADVCVSVDLDEVLRPGWRAALEAAWTPGTKQALYRYTWSFLPDGSEGCVFWREQIHARHGFRWKHPVHEVLVYEGTELYRRVQAEGIQLDHRADETKSRAQYLPLLELAVAEEPESGRNAHYLGREYMVLARWDDAIAQLRRHLALPGATWAQERCASYRFLARCLAQRGDGRESLRALLRACAEAPELREPWVELAEWMYAREDWEGCAFAARRALSITRRGEGYICEARAWGALPWDLAALGLWYSGRGVQAVRCAAEAARLAPEDERLRRNLAYMEAAAAAE